MRVSIIISTYNSSKFIIETLESVLNQTWKNLELIITDDCSEDNTLELCYSWVKDHHKRFADVKIIESKHNTGISCNANRGLYASTGDWIKFLGADDTLKVTCIDDNVDWVKVHPETRILFSRVEIYHNSIKSSTLISTTEDDTKNKNSIVADGRDVNSQYKMLLKSDRIHFSPTMFINRKTLIALEGFDERFRNMEDYPLWLKLTSHGYKLFFMNKITVNYRLHSNAINNNGTNYIIKPNYFKSELFRKKYIYPNLPLDLRLNEKFVWYSVQVFRIGLFNINNARNRFLYHFLTVYINPIKYYLMLRKLFDNSIVNDELYL